MAKKTVNSDIYNIASLIEGIKKIYIPNETEETLAIGTYGYISAIESNRLQTQVQMTGELSNESFPSRARLERNVITHAIMAGIDNINAIPSTMQVYIALRESEINDFIDPNTHTFIIDRECPIFFGDFEFHLEYDIKLKRVYEGNDKNSKYAYSAEYVINEQSYNPISTATDTVRYLSSPAIIDYNNDKYIYITTNIRQVCHNTDYKKLVTSNIIDNKVINFEFEDQLAYFQVYCSDTSNEPYPPLTPVFEGSAPEEGTSYYCWYQYIDTHLIRVRFDRQSYMPTLNTQIEIRYKTTTGSEGNFTYKEDVFATLTSSTYGYKNIKALVTPISDATGGKDRKSKSELQGLIPKEAYARGSLTTITDLNNYFSTLDSEDGRIIVKKKIDNQIERVYYTYMIAKDNDNNIIPSNTITIKAGMDDLVVSSISESQAPRYVLKSGKCIKLGNDGIGYINHDPILGSAWSLIPTAITQGKFVKLRFKANFTDTSYDAYQISATVDGVSTADININGGYKEPQLDSTVEEIENYMQVGIGRTYSFKTDYLTSGDGPITIDFNCSQNALDFVGGSCVINGASEIPVLFNSLPFTLGDVAAGSTIEISIFAKVNLIANNSNLIDSTIHVEEDEINTDTTFNCFVPTLKSSINPGAINPGEDVIYELTYLSSSKSKAPQIIYKFSKGIEYMSPSNTIEYEGQTPYSFEPTKYSIAQDAGFIYTNPYAISINHYHLYSAFYMMAIDENPYLHFTFVNDESNIQFIATNLNWTRPFLSGNDKYNMRITITQTVQENLGIITDDAINCKVIAVFWRDGKPYRYRTLDYVPELSDESIFSYTFEKDFFARDILDNDNNIMVDNVIASGQVETYSATLSYSENTYKITGGTTVSASDVMEALGISGDIVEINSTTDSIVPYNDSNASWKIYVDSEFSGNESLSFKTSINGEESTYFVSASCLLDYGFFNDNTKVVLYALANLDAIAPSASHTYQLDGLDGIVPGLSGWGVTNEYEVVNGISMYHNYSEIMGSSVTPYGTTSHDPETDQDVLNLEGYYITGVPVLGYEYCQNELYAQKALDALNSRKAYIDNIVNILENSFGVDFKLFNTYGPSRTYYIIKDSNSDGAIDDENTKEYINNISITMNFRLKLVSSTDSYTKNNIIADIKDYIEDLTELGDLHIPNLVTQITNTYQEQIVYFEYLGFNSYGANIQHIYKDEDDTINIHIAPEFLNVQNYVDTDGNISPEITINVSGI